MRVKPVQFYTKAELIVDALYLHVAREAHDRATVAKGKIETATQNWTALDEKWKQIEQSTPDLSAQYDLLEPLGVQLEGADYQIGSAYGLMIKEIAIVHILSAAALEAHINGVAAERLTGKDFDHFEKLSLEAKWLFLPRLLGLESFNPGNEPFQSFSRLIKIRNELVHYKGHQEDWVSGGPPAFLSELGLTLVDSEKALKSVFGMIDALARMMKTEPPYWLRKDLKEMNYFDVSVSSS